MTDDVQVLDIGEGDELGLDPESPEEGTKKKRGGPPRAPKGYVGFVRTAVFRVRELRPHGWRAAALDAVHDAHKQYVRTLLDQMRDDPLVKEVLDWAAAVIETGTQTEPPKLPVALYFANHIKLPQDPYLHSSLRAGARLLVAYTVIGFLGSVIFHVKQGKDVPSWPTEARPPMDEWLQALEEMLRLGNDLKKERTLVAQLLASGYRAKRERLELGDVWWCPGTGAVKSRAHAALLTKENPDQRMGVVRNHFALLYLHNPKSPHAREYKQEAQPRNVRRDQRWTPLLDARRMPVEELSEEALASTDPAQQHYAWSPSGKTAMLLPLETSRKTAWVDKWAGAVWRGEARLATMQVWRKGGRWFVACQIQWVVKKPELKENWFGVAWDRDTPVLVNAAGDVFRVATEGLTPLARMSKAELRKLQIKGQDVSYKRAVKLRARELVPIWARLIVRLAAAHDCGIAVTGVNSGKPGIPQAELEEVIRRRAIEHSVPVRFGSFKGALAECPECDGTLTGDPRPPYKRGTPRPAYNPVRRCSTCSYEAQPGVLIARRLAIRTAASVAAGAKEASPEPM